MSSNIRVNRICQHCKIEFVAKTTVTKFCSYGCAKRAYKAAIRKTKITQSNEEISTIKSKPFESVKTKDYLTVKDASLLLSSSIKAVYKMIENGRVVATNLSKRKTLIKRSEIDKLFECNVPLNDSLKGLPEKKFRVSDFYTITEAEQKAGMSNKAFFDFLKREGVTKTQKGKFVYVPKS